ncbi:family 78 glycoside hydrolase catalytic domain [Yinghuangia sp. YIM S10712]|uniref:family 78 glycoside hydrolase catalytic domain n=1 Tax=Yinghuangia sp. YIM S10712 TaxID=3436930 RepID=UPI003F53AAD8
MTSTRVAAPTFEHHAEALGVGEPCPRISWKTVTEEAGWQQAAYEVAVDAPGGEPAWRSGRVVSGESVLVPWGAPALRSRDRREVRVRVWGAADSEPSAWSPPSVVEAGLLDTGDFTAGFVTPDWSEDTSVAQPATLLRRGFVLRAPVASARLYITALGVYEAEINGVRVGDQVLAPGWTSYQHRLRYQTFDVTGFLQPGANAIGAWVGDGWYRGRLGFEGGRRNIYGEHLGLLAQLEILYSDGTAETVTTDGEWQASRAPITSADLYDGESYDARREQPGWSQPGFDDRDWTAVRALDVDRARLVAPTGPPVRRIEEISPVEILTTPSGRTIVDFGQNLVGRLRITARAAAGHTVTLRHAEVLEDGELGTRPLRLAKATDSYTFRGGETEVWEPRFTVHGFRYAEVENWPGTLTLDDLTAVVLHTDMTRTGWFTCSDPMIDRLHENVVWSMRGNFLDVPTDCPQRDERLGWTGDILVFTPTAAYLYDCAGLLTSWLRDLAAEQQEAGGPIPLAVPGLLPAAPIAVWGDASTLVPWVLYQRTGDLGLLRDQFASMTAWMDVMTAHHARGGGQFGDDGIQMGDWLDPSALPEHPSAGRTDRMLVAAAYMVRSAEVVAATAELLGREDDRLRFAKLADEVRAQFQDEFISPHGRVSSDSQTAYALALQFALLPTEEARRGAARRLAELVRESRHAIGTGFVGTPLICDALCTAGALDTAYLMLTRREVPSFLYPLTMGATTMWERWDSMLPDGAINPGEMTSFNHYAFGAIADWLHRTVAGLAPAAPGYRKLLVRPVPGAGLTSATAAHETPYGRAEVAWQRTGTALTVDVTVPPNTTARIEFPDGTEPVEVGSGQHSFRVHCRAAEDDPTSEPTALERRIAARSTGAPIADWMRA